MNPDTIRGQLREVNDDLARIDKERDALLALLRGFEGWLELHGSPTPTATQTSLALVPAVKVDEARTTRSSKPKGEMPFRKAILLAIEQGRGQPLHAREILARARGMGATTDAKNPEQVVDLNGYSWRKRGAPIERVALMTWRWVGTEASPGT